MKNVVIFTIVCLFSNTVFANSNPAPLQIKFQNQQYQLEYNQKKLLAKTNKSTVKGELEKSIGDFSQWEFRVANNNGFDIIINQKDMKVLSQKDNLEANGPFLVAASPDSKYVVFDYGTSHGPRNFEVRTDQGKVIFKDTYLNNLVWTKDGLEYSHPTELDIHLNKQTKACRALGSAWELHKYRFDGVENKRLDVPPSVACSH